MVKVLLADDSTELRERLVEMLSLIPGLDVVGQVSSVSEARLVLPDLYPDLVILDLQMRDGSGIDILRELRSTHPETKVIVFTNHPEEQYRQRCFDLGVSHFLSKSTDSRLLIEMIGQLAHNSIASIEADAPTRSYEQSSLSTSEERYWRAIQLLRQGCDRCQQSQKLEAVSQLAGGVAHDFNNILTVIIGYTDLSLRRIGPEDSIRHNLEETKKAAERATSLIRHLLAFSRRVKADRALETTSSRGSETILLVETEDAMRGLMRMILMQAGYYVLDTRSGEEAILLGRAYGGPIDLLLTDVVMPDSSGKEVADCLKEVRPSVHVLFMSGHTDEAMVRHAVLDANIEFIQKPFTWAGLAKKVRDVLDDAPRVTQIDL